MLATFGVAFLGDILTFFSKTEVFFENLENQSVSLYLVHCCFDKCTLFELSLQSTNGQIHFKCASLTQIKHQVRKQTIQIKCYCMLGCSRVAQGY